MLDEQLNIRLLLIS